MIYFTITLLPETAYILASANWWNRLFQDGLKVHLYRIVWSSTIASALLDV